MTEGSTRVRIFIHQPPRRDLLSLSLVSCAHNPQLVFPPPSPAPPWWRSPALCGVTVAVTTFSELGYETWRSLHRRRHCRIDIRRRSPTRRVILRPSETRPRRRWRRRRGQRRSLLALASMTTTATTPTLVCVDVSTGRRQRTRASRGRGSRSPRMYHASLSLWHLRRRTVRRRRRQRRRRRRRHVQRHFSMLLSLRLSRFYIPLPFLSFYHHRRPLISRSKRHPMPFVSLRETANDARD